LISLARPQFNTSNPAARRLEEAIVAMPFDDCHCHPISDLDIKETTTTTPEEFLLGVTLPGFGAEGYFPHGVFEQWIGGDAQVKAQLRKKYNMDGVLGEITYHLKNSLFTVYMVKEMAAYLKCRETLEDVVAARNERTRADYYAYMRDLFKDVHIANVMNDTGCCGGLTDASFAKFGEAIKPAQLRPIARVDHIEEPLLKEDISFDVLESRFLAAVRSALDDNGNFGMKSYGMKSYLLPEIGLIEPIYDPSVAKKGWEEYKQTRNTKYPDRVQAAANGKVIRQYTLTLSMEECLKRNMPMQFHAGDGEPPEIILRNQHPYYLEEIVRFEKDGLMRMPKVIAIHAGYPLLGEEVWLTYLYTNCYMDVSVITALITEGLTRRYLEILEVVPFSKVLFGSDAYHLPELYWLAGKWGKPYLARALAIYVDEGILDEEGALQKARQILYENNRRVYNIT
jgi:predicted TIM-barrel fold metal-dependent hydrolase